MKIFSKNTDLWNKSNHLKLLFEKKSSFNMRKPWFKFIW